MSNRGFKGTKVGLSAVSISGSMAEVQVQFVNETTGQTHGIMKHTIPLTGEGADKDVARTVEDFLTALRNHITQLHFMEPEVGKPIEEAARGISESLRGESDEPA